MFFSPPVHLIPPVYRPPSEANSLLVQVTIGCSNNKCTYCDMYRSKEFKIRKTDEIIKDLKSSAYFYKSNGVTPRRIFLCDGDALGAPMETLVSTLEAINSLFPSLDRVGIYATAANMLEKTEAELKTLAKLKLTMAYLGLESGSDKVLHMIVKGNTANDMVVGSSKIQNAGIKLSTIVMLGVGGKKHSKEHVAQTIKVLNQSPPNYFSFLTTFSVPGTPYDKMVKRGLIEPLTSKELLVEMKHILEGLDLEAHKRIIFRANHVSNQFPIGGILPRDKKKILSTLESWINQTPEGIFPPKPPTM